MGLAWFENKKKEEMPQYIKRYDSILNKIIVYKVTEWFMETLSAKTEDCHCYLILKENLKFSQFQYYPASEEEYMYFINKA